MNTRGSNVHFSTAAIASRRNIVSWDASVTLMLRVLPSVPTVNSTSTHPVMFRSLARCDDPERFGAWLYGILVNRCRTTGARAARRRRVFVRDDDAISGAAHPNQADRVEWAVYSLLSTAGPLSEAAFLDRIAGLFIGPDQPDEALVRACLDSYRSLASTADRIVTADDVLRRGADFEYASLAALQKLCALADGAGTA